MARAYCEEGASFLEPRVATRSEGTTGVTGTEFPLLNWLSGRIGCLTGDFVTPWRVLSLLAAALLAWSLWRRAGWMPVLVLATSPLTPYFSRATQPDMAAAGFAALALASPTPWVALVAVALAVLIKLPAAVYLLPVAWQLRGRFRLAVPLALVPALLWYAHALSLQSASGLYNFGLVRSPFADWLNPKFWFLSFVSRPFDVWIFPGATLLLFLRRPDRVLAATALGYILLCGYTGAHHEYYGVLLLPALCLMVAHAWAQLPRGRIQVAVALCVLGIGWQLFRGRKFWASNVEQWAEVERWRLPPGRISVYSDGSPQLFWHLNRVGRMGAGETLAAVDRLRGGQGPGKNCEKLFENEVAMICRVTPP